MTRKEDEEEWRSWNLLITCLGQFSLMGAGSRVYILQPVHGYVSPSPADLELCPWLHLDRRAMNGRNGRSA